MIILYTFIQIIIESLPISSSGHALLLCGRDAVSPAYDYFLHGFSVLVILMYFFRDYFFLLSHWHRACACIIKMCVVVVIADCITALWYFLLPHTPFQQLPLPIGFLITGFALLSTYWARINHRRLHWLMRALIMGFVQGVALMSGISRMGCTYAAARWMGLRPYRAMALSLVIQLPLIGAGFLKGAYQLCRTGELAHYFSLYWLCIYSIAMVLAYICLWFTMYLAQREKMWLFGVYVLLLACVCFL